MNRSRQHFTNYLIKALKANQSNSEKIRALKATQFCPRQALKTQFWQQKKAQSLKAQKNEVKSVIAATAVSQVPKLMSLWRILCILSLQHESPYAEILEELNGETKQVSRNSLIFKRMHRILYVHDHKQDADLDFWRIVVPENEQIKTQVVQELHCTPYSAHPGIQRTIARVKRYFYWKATLGDIRKFIENCLVCQTETSDHTLAKGRLMSTQIPESKGSEISIGFITDLPPSANGRDSILVTVGQSYSHGAPCTLQKKYHSYWHRPVAVEHCN